MGIKLYKHNQTAYDKAVAMLSDSGMAAIIHPTGTGKSLIGFRLAQDNPKSKICWLSPSEYIYKTQIENAMRIDNTFSDGNICFYSYAKLMAMDEEEMAEISPDYIILDEFHRCGADMWGKGVRRLLDIYPTVPVLGLSATNIRYLDNQRDMADELFDGNVVSYMSLGEALVRGILPTPKYVTAVYSYQKQLKKYERRIKEHKTAAVADEGQRILEKLKRALEKADGLSEIFNKYITEKSGKYIIFCANESHMRGMINGAYQWFYDIDPQMHIYRAYSDDPATSKAFAKFKKDNSEHLKLLFCINMLNEGVHVDDISGVILFRPTVSPIIYKQQIGRALAAGKNGTPLILDIVNNFENLYSVGTIEDEMRQAVGFFRANDMEGEIVSEHFRVEDEYRDCRILFEQLNQTLTASWDLMYSYAAAYYRCNGNLNVPKRYKTVEGYSLGNWVLTQKRIYNGTSYGNLDGERIKKLEEIGIVWESADEARWERYYSAAEKYFTLHGNLDVAAKYVTEDGIRLGEWIARLRGTYAGTNRGKSLSDGQKAKLDAIGMIWDKNDFIWKSNFAEAERFYLKNGDLNVSANYISESGFKLGAWLNQTRLSKAQGALSAEKIAALDGLGFDWESKYERKWKAALAEAAAYAKSNGNLNVPVRYVTSSGFALGKWISSCREKYKRGTISAIRIADLSALGMDWRTDDGWMTRYNLLKSYYERHGDIKINQSYVENGIWLGKWLYQQKQNKNKLTKEQISLLDELNTDWHDGNRDMSWQRRYNEISALIASGKDIAEIKKTRPYGGWIANKVQQYRDGKLSEEKKEQLESLGVSFEKRTKQPEEERQSKSAAIWDSAYAKAEAYFKEHGDLYVPNPYKTEDGFDLGYWIYVQRDKYKKGELSDGQVKRLETIDMSWLTPSEYLWEKSFLAASEYFSANGNLNVPVTYKTTDGVWLGRWISKQKKSREQLPGERITRLEQIGIEWDKKAK